MIGKAAQILCLVLLCGIAQPSFADTADWNNGRVAYGRGDHASALRYFLAARNGGLDSPAVHYNIAVCHFKLGHFKQAEGEFRLIADRFPKLRGLAEYNLGLVARRERDLATATRHFLAAYRLSPENETLRVLASNRLRELEPKKRTASHWAGAIGVRTGYDDNVALRDEAGLPATLTTESSLLDLFASIKGPGSSGSGLQIKGSFYAVRNFDADDFDQAEISGGAMYLWRPEDWRLQLGAHSSVSALGGNSFDRKNGIDLRAVRHLDENSSFDLSYVYDNVKEAGSLFAGIGGSRQQIQAMYRWHSNDHRLSLRYRQEVNDRLDPNASPKRKAAVVDYRYRPVGGWGYEAGLRYRASRYDSLPVLRREDLLTLKTTLTRSFADNWLLLLELQISNNDSSDSVFSYDRTQLTLGAMRVF